MLDINANVRKLVTTTALLAVFPLCPASLANTPKSQTVSSHKIGSEQSQKIAKKIYQVLKKYQLSYDIDKRSIDVTIAEKSETIVGEEEFIQKIAAFVEKNEPIQMAMIGFPIKSANQDKKVLGPLPDMAERFSLTYIQKMLEDIHQVYLAGATFTLICDGVAFSDVTGHSDAELIAYEAALKQLGSDLNGIRILTSENLMVEGIKSLYELREAIDTEESSQKQISAEDLELMKKRMALELDNPEGQKLLQSKPIQKICQQVLQRSSGFGKFLAKHNIIPSAALPFSVHFQKDLKKKFGLKLSPTSFITPWHGVLVEEKDNTSRILHKMDVDPALYQETGSPVNGIHCRHFKRR